MDFLNFSFESGPIKVVVWEVLYVGILFFLLVAVLKKFLYGPILAILDERAKRLSTARDRRSELLDSIEERQVAQGERLAQARRDAVAALEQAKREGEAARTTKIDEARARAAETVDAATQRIDAAVAAEEANIRKQADELARAIATAVLGREVA